MPNEQDALKQELIKQPYVLMLNDQPHQDSGIDIFQLLATLNERRGFIASVIAVFLLLAVCFALTIKPQYQVKTELVPPNSSQYQSLRMNTDIKLNDMQLFDLFLKKLVKKSNMIAYLEESGLVEKSLKNKKNLTMKDKFIQLNKWVNRYQVSVIQHSKSDMNDSFRDGSKEAGLTTVLPYFDLNAKQNLAYLNYTNQQVLAEIQRSQRAKVQAQIQAYEDKISSGLGLVKLERESEIKRMEDQQQVGIADIKNKIEALKEQDKRDKALRIKELDDALQLAKTLGIVKYNEGQTVDGHNVVINWSKHQSDLYLRGTQYLEKEIGIIKASSQLLMNQKQISALEKKLYVLQHDQKILALKSRADDEPYLNKLAAEKLELQRLKSLSFDVSGVQSYALAGPPIIDASPIKSSKRMIVMLGGVLGLMLAVLIVMIQTAYASRQEELRVA